MFFFSTFEIYFRFNSCLKDCCNACCTVIGAMFCIITFPVIVYGSIEVFSQSEATTCFIMAVVLIIYIIFARTVILGFKNLMCYKINGAVYNMVQYIILTVIESLIKTKTLKHNLQEQIFNFLIWIYLLLIQNV